MGGKSKRIPIIEEGDVSIEAQLIRYEKKLKEIDDFLYNTKVNQENVEDQVKLMEKIPALYIKLKELKELKALDDEIRGDRKLSLLDDGSI